MKNEKYKTPEGMLNAYRKQYKNIATQVRVARRAFIERGFNFDKSLVFAPHDAFKQMIMQKHLPNINELAGQQIKATDDMSMDLYALTALSGWMFSRKVYKFSEVLVKQLNETNCDNIPVEILKRIGDFSVFIETPGLVLFDINVTGFFAHYDQTDFMSPYLSFFVLLEEEGNHHQVLPLQTNKTVKEIINDLRSTWSNSITDDEEKKIVTVVSTLVNFVLYVCSDSPDIEEGMRAPVAHTKKKKPKIEPKRSFLMIAEKNRNFFVGRGLDEHLKKITHISSSNDKRDKRTVKAHIRRAHWHTFFKGQADANGEKEFYVKWLSPIIVNAKL